MDDIGDCFHGPVVFIQCFRLQEEDPLEEKITVYEKAPGETVKVNLFEYRGTKHLVFSEWHTDKDQEEKQTELGVMVSLDRIVALRQAIDRLAPIEEKIEVHKKLRGETINVYASEFQSNKYLHIREWLAENGQEQKPTRKGISIPVENIAALHKAINHFVSP